MLKNDADRRALGRRAFETLQSQRGATQFTMEKLRTLLKTWRTRGAPRVNPLSSLYGMATATHNHFYDSGTFKSRKLSRPVISVGNISVGGSGKTPFVILLGELLKRRGIAFDVLSRGYGRETHGVLAVDPTGSARDFGDEPLLIARRLGCPVIVGESRYKAGIFAERNYDSAIHILDDGFQHRCTRSRP